MFKRLTTDAQAQARSAGTIRVLLADGHELVRAGVRALLEKIENVMVAGEAGDGHEVLEFLARDEPDVLLMAFLCRD
jgi:DNA-binding NarL/FixJ family response regulator